MKHISLLVVALLINMPGNGENFDEIFVDQEWLYSHLEDESLVILHLDKPENYIKGHIPGALFVDNSIYAAVRDGLYFELPEAAEFAEELKKRGVDKTKKVIISSGWDTFAHAYRFYVTMEYFGLADQAKILDGGIRGWQAEGFTVSTDTVIPAETRRKPVLKTHPEILVDKDWIKINLSNPEVSIIDARKSDFYTGSEKGNYKRGGHIMGAKNLTWTTLVDENFTLLEPGRLRDMYTNIIDEEEKTLVCYCHVALRASVLYTVGKALGYDVRLYDGSFNEWDGLDESFPVENE
ncbi:MAG: sulfurtransferase [Cyclobacteriaceae bacterium]|nr:sulfurtransferase [Cyclobacteriaceae bacterium]